ncbi:HlyD family secretion protein [Candidatus Symbiothrix dinenymphae]|nr:HlyD family secretion protein [Candidatus Symbiothrix dinenymphae]
MLLIFPPEIINDTTEALFVKRSIHSKAIYLVVVFAVAATLAALPFIYVQVSTQARGTIRTPNENNPLQTSVYGEVTDIRIAENAEVLRGDTLLVLNSASVQVQAAIAAEKMREDLTFVRDIQSLLIGNFSALTTPKYLNERNFYNTSLDELQTKIDYLKNELDVTEKLYTKNVNSKSEYLQYKNNYDAAVRQHANQREQFLNRWQSEKTNYELEIKSLQADVQRLEDEQTKYVLKAPASGAVIQFSGIRKGNFIAPGQTLGYISDAGDLLVECYVSPTDIGYISENQPVAFQLDAFNYNQWGLAHGRIREISKDIILMNEQPVFRVRCSLDTPFLQLKNGYKGNLKKGMTLTGRFYLTDRSLWQLLFDKVDNWVNPKIV